MDRTVEKVENMKMKRYRISNRATFWKQVKLKIIVETFRLLREMSIGFRRIKKEAMAFRQSQFRTVESGPGITVLKLGKDGPIFKIYKRRAPSQKPRAGKKIGNITW